MEGDTSTVVKEESKIKSYAGIPEAEFMDDVDKYMTSSDVNGNADLVLQALEQQHHKYKFMELNLMSKKRRLKSQIPDLERSLDMIQMLTKLKDSPEDLETQFLLSNNVYMKASVPPTDKVCLWLGANVMLEYTLEDAMVLLKKNIDTAKTTMNHVDHDLDFLRDQCTTTEVNMARVFNWNVKRRNAVKTGV